jgi:hypothetical protein
MTCGRSDFNRQPIDPFAGVYETAKLSPGERSLLVKDHLTEIFFHRQLALLVRLKIR